VIVLICGFKYGADAAHSADAGPSFGFTILSVNSSSFLDEGKGHRQRDVA